MMYPSVFKVLLYCSLLAMSHLPMSKHALILKGGTSALLYLQPLVKGVSFFILCTVLCGMLLGVTITGMKVMCVSL